MMISDCSQCGHATQTRCAWGPCRGVPLYHSAKGAAPLRPDACPLRAEFNPVRTPEEQQVFVNTMRVERCKAIRQEEAQP